MEIGASNFKGGLVRAYQTGDTIVALATAPAIAAIGVIRLSGDQSFNIVSKLFKGKNLNEVPTHSIHFGSLRDEDQILDEVLVSVFKGPKSYTGEDVIEISCHGSPYIQQKIIESLVKNGARLAEPGEFTLRAFLNRKLDLTQAEAVADLIASDSSAALKTAMNQMRGGFGETIKKLREELIHFASLVELELDFSEEDVEFADRSQLKILIERIIKVCSDLIISFQSGNVIRNGIPTVIAGRPNAGKSTLLNALLNEERAIVSEIAGTTRDTIEEAIQIKGINFRFIDTAGIRAEADSEIEKIGIERTFKKAAGAELVLYLFDINTQSKEEVLAESKLLRSDNKRLLLVANKCDQSSMVQDKRDWEGEEIVFISAKEKNIESLINYLASIANENLGKSDQTLISNVRHLSSLQETVKHLEEVIRGMDMGLSGDLLAEDIRGALYQLGLITGEISTDDLLENIFTKFCIGK